MRKGDRVVIVMANCPEVPVAYGATWRAGAAITPAMFLLPPDEIRRIIEDSGATAVITTPEFLANVQTAAKDLPDVLAIISTGPPAEGVISLDALTKADMSPMVATDADDLAAILYTGGTTGQSKGVMLTHENLRVMARGAFEASDVIDGDRAITALPLAHGYGMMSMVAASHGNNGYAVLMRWFDPSQWPQLVQDHKIRRAAVVPTMLQLLLSQPLEDYDLSSLEVVNSGAAPLAKETILEFERRVPSCLILEGYGCSESGVITSVNRRGNRKIGSVGLPFPGYEVKCVDDDGKDMGLDEVGEICVRSGGVMEGYWKSPELNAEVLTNGWLHTGDIGKVDADGFVWIVDRKKDLIIRGGFNVFPRDVEDALLEDPAIEMAGVVGRPDTIYGEEVVAFVSLRSGASATPEEIIEHSKTKLGKYKYPREVHVVGYLPLTPVGKVDRKALRKML